MAPEVDGSQTALYHWLNSSASLSCLEFIGLGVLCLLTIRSPSAIRWQLLVIVAVQEFYSQPSVWDHLLWGLITAAEIRSYVLMNCDYWVRISSLL
jgi:hypothetical protein